MLKTSIPLLLLLLFTGCGGSHLDKTAYLDPDGESGIGGTGIIADESGLGGTGIIGEITGFGSIFVNGIEIELDKSTHLYIDGEYVRDHDFAVGDVVEIVSTKRAGKEVARTIHIRHEVIGPVEQRNVKRGTLRILDQEVVVNAADLPQLNQYVSVSGFRDQWGRIHARRIETVTAQTALFSGQLRQAADKVFYVGKQRLIFGTKHRPAAGQFIRIRGILRDDGIHVQRYQTDTAEITRASRHLYIQGFISRQAGGQFNIANKLINALSPEIKQQLSQQTGRLVRLELHRQQGPHRHTGGWQIKRIISADTMPHGHATTPRQHRSHYNRQDIIHPFRPDMPRRPNTHPGFLIP